MALTIPQSVPDTLRAGDSWRWDDDALFETYPSSDGWTLSYAFRGASALDITTTATASTYQARVTAGNTATLEPGLYTWAAYVTNEDGDRFTVGAGAVTVSANLAVVVDGRSHAARTLAIIEQVIEGRITANVEHFMINGRQVTRIPMPDLHKLRVFYSEEVRREEAAAAGNGGFLQPVEVRFGPVL